MNKKFLEDYERTGKKWNLLLGHIRFIKRHDLLFLYWGRKAEGTRFCFLKRYYELRQRWLGRRYGLEMNCATIGGGGRLIHPFNITVNESCHCGKNLTLFKGVTIGAVRGGRRAGHPVIGDNVTICMNASVVGRVVIGNDVVIAANSFVDFDVPNGSVVVGNPGVIHKRKSLFNEFSY